MKVMIANPAGNITVMVLDPVARCDYPAVASRIMSLKTLKVEQVGFVALCKGGADGRVEMAGGEFCGNAARSFGFYLSKIKGLPSPVKVEISGVSEPVLVTVNGQNASARMPLPVGECKLLVKGIGALPVIRLPGIDHCIAIGVDPSEKNFNQILNTAIEQLNPEAFGVMFYSDKLMTPVVYVRQPYTVFFEGSCGSGTAALGAYLAKTQTQSCKTYTVSQPAGVITVRVEKDSTGEITTLEIGGEVSLETAQL